MKECDVVEKDGTKEIHSGFWRRNLKKAAIWKMAYEIKYNTEMAIGEIDYKCWNQTG